MPKMSINRPHSIEIEEAKNRVQALVEEMQKQFPTMVTSIQWSPDRRSAKVSGSMFDGSFEVDPKEVKINLNLSFLASPFRSKIESQINQVLDQRFGTA